MVSQGKQKWGGVYFEASWARANLGKHLPPCLTLPPSQVLHCQLSAEEVRFPVSVTQQSPAAVSMETYHVTLTLPPTQVEGNVGN